MAMQTKCSAMELQTKALFSSYGYFYLQWRLLQSLFRILCSIICPHKLSQWPAAIYELFADPPLF